MTSEKRSVIEERLQKFVSNNETLKQNPKFMSPDNQKKLVESLLDGSVHSVVSSLTHLQELKETELLNQRYRRVKELGNSQDQAKIDAIDRNICEQIDEMVAEQQSNLGCVGVPLFYVTKETEEIRLQMEIIKFIISLQDVF